MLKGVKYDDSLTLVDGLGMKVTDDLARERLRIGQTGPGEYGLAMFNKTGDKTIWQDATTGDARFRGILTASSFEGGTITIGSGNNVFKADSNGIYLGNASFAAAPFRVNMAGHMVASGAEFSGTISASIISGGQINGTTISGTNINGGTITGALIRTAETGQRIELSSINKLLKAYWTDTTFLSITTSFGVPGIDFFYNGTRSGILTTEVDGSAFGFNSSTDAFISATNNIKLNPIGGVVLVSGWNRIGAGNPLSYQTLQDALNSKAVNLVFNPATRMLKLYAGNGSELASVDLSSLA